MKAKKFAYEVRFFGFIFVSLAEKIIFIEQCWSVLGKMDSFEQHFTIFWLDFTKFKYQIMEILSADSADNSNQKFSSGNLI